MFLTVYGIYMSYKTQMQGTCGACEPLDRWATRRRGSSEQLKRNCEAVVQDENEHHSLLVLSALASVRPSRFFNPNEPIKDK